ncbi:SMR family transporter [Helicobacter mustelae]|uniref:Spermidine export protein MdtI n=1 Tax=Helicobacter mustelae (strain ATCC 43772 / CCUG 25715 / CIP 103759 / LMG 18044 / NCTC 12198 / R85-136P) TaxID=679897 RepID=D3UJB8_HELM1|nr:SMR family transporter [Helicobacter mustelae]CBG40593.1 putative efflux protein (Multidrug resistance protein) [Helicobacter mustelae 12198]SQH72090.1 multidrug resistance efflux protein [Helicobacter mustelae]STP13234.1 multidrug resistance efflux protein [Helicobacter mustelae]
MGIFFVLMAALLDILANLLLKKSNGFANKFYGVGAICAVLIAFVAISFAMDFMPLSIAYASWGAIGIVGTILGGYFFFGEKINKIGILGVICVLFSIVLLHIS